MSRSTSDWRGGAPAGEVIETARLLLRLPRPEDAEALLNLVEDREIMHLLADEPGGIERARELTELWIDRWSRNGVGQFVVEREGDVIGRVGLIVRDMPTGSPSSYDLAGERAQEELGWALSRRAWGNGYATEAAQAVRVWAQARGIGRLISLIAPDNLRSQRVAERLGASLEGRVETSFGQEDVWGYPPLS